MTPRIGDAVSQSFSRTGRLLFKPFDAATWFVLGFSAWLMQLCQSDDFLGAIGNMGNWQERGDAFEADNLERFTRDVERWIDQNFEWLAAGIVAGVLVVAFLIALMQWLRARATFMFMDGLVTGSPGVVEPWKAFRKCGNSLFGLLLAVALLSILFTFTGFAVMGTIIWPELRSGTPDPGVLMGTIAGGILYLFVYSIAFWVAGVIILDFIAPAMYLRDCSFGEAWRCVRTDVIRGRKGLVTRYLLMRLLLDVGGSSIISTLTCLTCCLVAIPYLGTVLFLPVYAFLRYYPLCFLDQFGPEWRFFDDGATGGGEVAATA